MTAYAAAAGRYLRDSAPTNAAAASGVADATLYFLRPGLTHRVPVTPAMLQATEERISELGARLIAARRCGRFDHNPSGACSFCPYHTFCSERRNAST
jgi:CRISPR/Cas system-associated exonuclease Cas4 (RecB family)